MPAVSILALRNFSQILSQFLLLLAWFLAIYSYTWLYLSYKTLGTSLAIKINYLGQKYWIGNVSQDMWKTSLSLFNNQCKIFFKWCPQQYKFNTCACLCIRYTKKILEVFFTSLTFLNWPVTFMNCPFVTLGQKS